MSELDEIMEGKHEINHLRIEEDTIAFETELNNHTWNLTPRDIEIIIYCLQKELQQKENIIKETKEEIEYFELQAKHLDDNIYLDEKLTNKLLEILNKGKE